MKIVLIRHGESEWNKLNLFTGWMDVELSEQGVLEAKQAGQKLAQAGLDFDICYTSYLKRAVNTLHLALTEMDRLWLPVIKSWRLNERHYGALQGLNKLETVAQYGEDQVKLWRRSFDVLPPALEASDPRAPQHQPAYRQVNPTELPLAESLKETIARAVPYFETEIKPRMQAGERVLIVAHGNSIRSLVKYFENLSDEAIMDVEIPTGVPLVYEFDADFQVISKRFLAEASELEAKINKNKAQTKA